jgi:hypothetical protein
MGPTALAGEAATTLGLARLFMLLLLRTTAEVRGLEGFFFYFGGFRPAIVVVVCCCCEKGSLMWTDAGPISAFGLGAK